VENGVVPIATEYFEALIAAQYPAAVVRFLMAVIRETWGYNRKEAPIPTARLEELMEVNRSRVYQLRKQAHQHNLIEIDEGEGSATPVYRVQRRYLDWLLWNSKETFDFVPSSAHSVQNGVDTTVQNGVDTNPNSVYHGVDTTDSVHHGVDGSVQNGVDTNGGDAEEACVQNGVDTKRLPRGRHKPENDVNDRKTERLNDNDSPPSARGREETDKLGWLLAQAGAEEDRPLVEAWCELVDVEGAAVISEADMLMRLRRNHETEAWRYGLNEAIRAGAGNPKYAEKAMQSYKRKPAGKSQRRQGPRGGPRPVSDWRSSAIGGDDDGDGDGLRETD
jgi:hypothetical protein